MKHLIKNPRDFWAGVMFLALGVGFAGIAFTYKLGTAARMGPGFFPFFLGIIVAALGVGILIAAMNPKNAGQHVDKFHWGPIFWVLMPIVVFGMLLKILGMMIMGLFVVILSSIGSEEFKLRPTVYLAFGLVIFCSAVFVGGLKLPIPLCPSFEFFDQFALCRV
ncbi:MAG TPA: tripartite tricarboxylate transporter TctB family protein [Usitatibacteraceae bacterium]|nr:tripartite tricarboxylate transporter TctB family protein [Usitatibacteraceae bacterium]